MGRGFLQVQTTAAESALPIVGCIVTISKDENVLYTLTTDENGNTEVVSVDAPDKAASLDPNYEGIPYARCDVSISAPGVITKEFHNVEIFDTITTILPVNMVTDAPIDYIDDPEQNGEIISQPGRQEIYLPEHGILTQGQRLGEHANFPPASPLVLPNVVIPLYVTVHLGKPGSSASNVTIPFREYVKNVASHEIYPTWQDSALRANIHCIISLVLNRIFTEWYRSRGFYFDITSETYNDQKFVYQGNIFANISQLVDQIFNQFLQREGHKEPFFAEYCNGTTVSCPGLSQWGSQELAIRGYKPIEILRYYYPRDIQIVETNNMQAVQESYPGYPLSQGMSGASVRVMQNYLNRIRVNYPNIPQINPVDGVFGTQTYNAVRAFQGIKSAGLSVTGVIDRATWFRIVYFYTAVKKLSELTSEGKIIGVGRTPPTVTIGQGSAQRREVGILQFLLTFISSFYPEVPPVIQDHNFGPDTANSVRSFQRAFGLTADGIVGPTTWRKLYEVYWKINDNMEIPPDEETPPTVPSFPGTPLRIGSSGAAVTQVQTCLNNIANRYPTIPKIAADGQFGNNTHNAVVAFQRIFGLAQDGVVGPITWDRIMTECAKSPESTIPPFPGTSLRVGSTGAAVTQIQTCLNNLTSRYPSIPKIAVDGHFGNNTRNAVIAFQNIFNLSADGVVGPVTWNRIMTECANVGTPGTIPPFPGTLLRLGSSGFAVTQIQNCLNNISGRFPTIPRLIVDGQFGNNTRNSVMALQRIFELAQDGIVGPITWNRIMTECGATGGTPSAVDYQYTDYPYAEIALPENVSGGRYPEYQQVTETWAVQPNIDPNGTCNPVNTMGPGNYATVDVPKYYPHTIDEMPKYYPHTIDEMPARHPNKDVGATENAVYNDNIDAMRLGHLFGWDYGVEPWSQYPYR